jgi:hypothetical protein
MGKKSFGDSSSTIAHLAAGVQKGEYYDTPFGRYRCVAIDGNEMVGEMMHKKVRVALCDCKKPQNVTW